MCNVHVYGFNQNKNKLCSVECKNWFNYENQIGSINQRSVHEERSKFSSRLLLLLLLPRGNASFLHHHCKRFRECDDKRGGDSKSEQNN